VRFALTEGQVHEMRVAHQLLADINHAYVIADRAYSSNALIQELLSRNCQPVIPSNPTHRQRPYDQHLYRDRALVENFFQRIQRFRRLAMRYEKLADRFLSFVVLASVLIWLI